MDMMKDESRSEKSKYEAPMVVAIKLRPEEAVLSNCKTLTSTTGPTSGGCHAVTCHQTGS